jgi:hypothetical protein
MMRANADSSIRALDYPREAGVMPEAQVEDESGRRSRAPVTLPILGVSRYAPFLEST